MSNLKQIKQLDIKPYEKNLLLLKVRYPNLAKRIDEIELNDNYQLCLDKDTKLFNVFIKDKQTYYYDKDDMKTSLSKEINFNDKRNTRVAVFLGFGLGYECLYYITTYAKLQRTSRLVIIEKDLQLFKLAMHIVDLSILIKDKNVTFYVDVPKEQLFFEFRKIFNDITAISSVHCMNEVISKTSYESDKKYYDDALKIIKEAGMYQVSSYGNSPQDSLWGIQHMFDNLEEIMLNPGINLLMNKFKGKPAVVVSSGPSLTKNVHYLKQIYDKAVIICAESTFKVLMKLGIKPHIVACLERTGVTKRSFEGFEKDEVKDVYMCGCPVIAKETYEAYVGPKIMVYRAFDHFKWLDIERGMLNIKISSGNMAFKLADALGCSPILIIGQDLAYERNNDKTHIDIVASGGHQKQHLNVERIKVPGNDGQLIETNKFWLKCLKGYEIDVSESNSKCINCTQGGAYIKGTEVMNFKDAIDKYVNKKISPTELIKNYLGEFKSQPYDESNKLAKKIEQTIKDLMKIIVDCKNTLKLYDQKEKYLEGLLEKENIEQIDLKKALSFSQQIYKSKIKIQTSSKTFQLMIMHIAQAFYIYHEMQINEIYKKSKDMNKAYIKAILTERKWFEFINETALTVLKEVDRGHRINDQIIKKQEGSDDL